ncbi:MAG TPA: TauD/TfdA family dioxygenase [Candidatus Tumulicola sp.]|jgi:taurine dioxygenase
METYPLTPTMGAIVEGVDLASPLTDHDVEEIRNALSRHLVLFFEEQNLTPTQQRDVAARFGQLYLHPFYPGHEEAPEVMVLAHDETSRAKSDRWHNDVTYLEAPPQATLLYAEEIPSVGGDTLWANMCLAYESLSEPLKRLVSELSAVHSFANNFTPERFRVMGIEDRCQQIYAEHPPVSHPVTCKDISTACRALFVNQDFTSHIEGISPRESAALLRLLYEHMAKPEFQVRWRWQAGNVAFWDNRLTQHCALAELFSESACCAARHDHGSANLCKRTLKTDPLLPGSVV